MKVTPTQIPEVLLLVPEIFSDARGSFMETWNHRRFAEIGVANAFVQDNCSRSVQGALRGLHYQIRQPQGKLIRVTSGEIFDVAVDIRKSSPTFGQWVGNHLSADNRRQLWVPPGFAHGFYVTSAEADVQYKCTDYYAKVHERCIRWDDPELAIAWPLTGPPLLSEKDRCAHALALAECFP